MPIRAQDGFGGLTFFDEASGDALLTLLPDGTVNAEQGGLQSAGIPISDALANGAGTHADRPTAGTAGVLYFETDTQLLFRDSGSDWVQVAPAAPFATDPPQVRTFAETDGSGSYTATVAVPAGALAEADWSNESVWNAATSATLNVTDDSRTLIANANLKTTPAAGLSISQEVHTGAFHTGPVYYPDGGTITATVVTVDDGSHHAGRSHFVVHWDVLPAGTAADKA